MQHISTVSYSSSKKPLHFAVVSYFLLELILLSHVNQGNCIRQTMPQIQFNDVVSVYREAPFWLRKIDLWQDKDSAPTTMAIILGTLCSNGIPLASFEKILLPRPPPPCTMLKLGFETGDWSSTLFGEVGGGTDSHKTCKRLLITVEITFSYFSLKYYQVSQGLMAIIVAIKHCALTVNTKNLNKPVWTPLFLYFGSFHDKTVKLPSASDTLSK